jgi:hypothetical protein
MLTCPLSCFLISRAQCHQSLPSSPLLARMRSCLLSLLALCVVLLAVSSVPVPVQADHCYAACCNLGWTYYGYNNATKRAAGATPMDSQCVCASEMNMACARNAGHPKHPIRGHGIRGPVPNDSCFGACCPGTDPSLKDKSPAPQFTVAAYGYSDYELIANPLGPCVREIAQRKGELWRVTTRSCQSCSRCLFLCCCRSCATWILLMLVLPIKHELELHRPFRRTVQQQPLRPTDCPPGSLPSPSTIIIICVDFHRSECLDALTVFVVSPSTIAPDARFTHDLSNHDATSFVFFKFEIGAPERDSEFDESL